MHINLEQTNQHTIQAYSATEVKINSVVYEKNLIISAHEIITDWPLSSITMLADEHLLLLMKNNPEIIIIGHSQPNQQLPLPIRQTLSKQRIGIECMSIGAACRTFNVLLSEHRNVVLGIIF